MSRTLRKASTIVIWQGNHVWSSEQLSLPFAMQYTSDHAHHISSLHRPPNANHRLLLHGGDARMLREWGEAGIEQDRARRCCCLGDDAIHVAMATHPTGMENEDARGEIEREEWFTSWAAQHEVVQTSMLKALQDVAREQKKMGTAGSALTLVDDVLAFVERGVVSYPATFRSWLLSVIRPGWWCSVWHNSCGCLFICTSNWTHFASINCTILIMSLGVGI